MDALRKHFPYLQQHEDVIYFDSAATALKPDWVINAINNYYVSVSANPHTSDYFAGVEATRLIEQTRASVKSFINAAKTEEIIFTSGTTDSLNQVAYGLSNMLQENDEIVLSKAEHSSNLAPWIELANKTKAKIVFCEVDKFGQINTQTLSDFITSHTKIIAFNHVSNVLGGVNNPKIISEIVRKVNKEIILVVDAAQSIPHMDIDVSDWDIDFLAFSGHKLYGPFGVGVLWGKYKLLELLTPLTYGGGSVYDYSQTKTNYMSNLVPVPARFEAGTPNATGIIGLNQAIKFVLNIGLQKINTYETSLKQYAVMKTRQLRNSKVHFLNLELDTPLLDFYVDDVNAQDIGIFLWDQYKICVRSGKHCAKMLQHITGVEATIRVSFAMYNNTDEIDKLFEALEHTDNYVSSILV